MSVVALGTWEHKEVFWNTQTSDVCWRVPDVRETIIAKPGNVILSSDYSQIEIKIMAFLSQDPGLIAAINSGKDIHSYIATDVFGATLNFDYDLMIKAIKDSTHPRNVELTAIRSRTKTTSFGIPYGAGPTKVALMTGLSLEEAQELIDVYLGRYPLLKAWLKEMGDNAINLGYSQSAGGRKRFYDIPELDNPDYNQIMSQIRRWGSNQPIQASGSDMLKRALLLIRKRVKMEGLSGRFKLVVHDEIVMEWAESEREYGQQVMTECMTEAYDYYIYGIKNKIDVVYGSHWKKG